MKLNRYHSLSTYMKKTFGTRVFKLSLVGEFTCPVRDGAISTGGCVFCNPDGNIPKHYHPGMPLSEQLQKAGDYVRKRHGTDSFLAYFQDYTATYRKPRELEKLYREALSFPGVKGIALCTRPDCISLDVMDLLQEISQDTFLWVELGIQSGSNSTLQRMRRGHTVRDSELAFHQLHNRGIRTAAHVILGFPGESVEEAMSTADLVRRSETAGVKIQNLHVIKGTELEKQYRNGDFQIIRRSVYASLTADFLERLKPETVIQRLTGEPPPRMLVAPEWCINKMAVLDRVKRELMYRDSWQGKQLGYSLEDIPGSASGTQ